MRFTVPSSVQLGLIDSLRTLVHDPVATARNSSHLEMKNLEPCLLEARFRRGAGCNCGFCNALQMRDHGLIVAVRELVNLDRDRTLQFKCNRDFSSIDHIDSLRAADQPSGIGTQSSVMYGL